MLDNKQIKIKIKVTVFFFAFLVNKPIAISKKPLLSIIPIPISIIIKFDNTLKLAKFATVLAKIYFNP